ncbi:hypothetical protein JOQ06_026679, partial [Pogonophryne albipinna]
RVSTRSTMDISWSFEENVTVGKQNCGGLEEATAPACAVWRSRPGRLALAVHRAPSGYLTPTEGRGFIASSPRCGEGRSGMERPEVLLSPRLANVTSKMRSKMTPECPLCHLKYRALPRHL